VILDARTWAALFIDGLSALLVVFAAAAAVRARLGFAVAPPSEGAGQLLALLLGTLLFLRVLAWGLFFLVLDGYVPRLSGSGVMCAYGVVQLHPALARAALWSKPAAVTALLAWWAVAACERDVPGAPFARLRFRLALPVALLAGVELACAGLWFCADKFEAAVTCCSAALDPLRETDWSAHTAVFGLAGNAALLAFLLAKAVLVAACAWAARSRVAARPAWALSLCVASIAVAWLGLAAWRDVIAPRALGLAFHRCAFEPIARIPLLGATAMGAALAHSGLLALALLAWIRAREPEAVERTASWIASCAALLLGSEILVLAVHAF